MAGNHSAREEKLLRQQDVLAKFGELALRSEDLEEILQEACRLVGDALGTDLAKVMELQEDGVTLLVRSGVGWKPGIVGEVRVRAEQGSSEGHALQTGKPVTSSDIGTETRFTYPDFLTDNGVHALVNVIIIGPDDEGPYGILEVDSRSPREFAEADITFLRGYANLLAAAVARLRLLEEARSRAAALRSLNESLEDRVTERTRALEAEQRERQIAEEAMRQSQKMEAVGQLTGGVAHDFNNLLTVIRSSVDLLRRPNLSEERRRRYIDAVSDTVDRAAKLTGQLLAFARRQALKPEVFDIGARLRAAADMLDTVTGARINITTEMPAAPCFIEADANQFETALVNLAVNARDAMDGAGQLTLRLVCGLRMPPIRGHAGAKGPFAAVSLTDTGEGIPADMLSRIFEPFFTTKEVGKGTGLGLSQVFGFTKQSGGDVAVTSEVGSGTTFTLYLPEVETETPPVSGEERPDAPSDGAGLRVLVVEDNIEVGHFATQILQDLGYETAWAANAEEALDRLGKDGAGFDVVFSDVVMPGMGGLALALELRQRLPAMPVVLASGYSHILAQEGAYGFELLNKPYSVDQLSRTLRRVIRM